MQILFLFIVVMTYPAPAAYAAGVAIDAELSMLAQHPTWQRLMYVDENGRSEVNSDNYFLAANGRSDLKAELEATIRAYSEPWPENPNQHPRCRFPARYFWMSQHMNLPGYQARESKCMLLERWAKFDRIKSISFMLVSGYMGNPGSTFGHSLVKINSGHRDDITGLFDHSVSYGAEIPDNEWILRYIFKGVFGGYKGTFADKYFYIQDLIYSHTEFRDVWEYELALSDDQQMLMTLHLWEVIGRTFDYLFLTKNCGYRLSELLEMVTGKSFTDSANIWYIPAETFHRLKAINESWEGDHPLVKRVRFIPSSQRKLHHQMSLLNDDQKQVALALIRQGPDAAEAGLSTLPVSAQLNVLDVALTYYNYRWIKEQPEVSKATRRNKTSVLVKRLRLPVATAKPAKVPPLTSPVEGNRPMLLAAGAGHESNQGIYGKLRWSPFSQEMTGQNSLEGDELVMLDTVLGIGGAQHALFIESFDLLRIRKLKQRVIEDENPWSWEFQTGAQLSEENGMSKYEGLLRFGVGRAWRFDGRWTLYAMADLEGHTLKPYARLRPHVGLLADLGRVKASVYGGVTNRDYKGEIEAVWGGQLQYGLLDQMSLFASVKKERTTRTSAELRWYW